MSNKYLSSKFRKELAVGEKIRTIRKRKQIMVKDLAAECGVTAKTMQNYEAGERQANAEKLDLIAEKLGVSPASIYYKFESVGDFFHFLFEAEREGLIAPAKCGDDVNEQFTSFGIRTSDESMNEALKAWYEERELYDKGNVSNDDYLNWQDAFPNQYDDGAPKVNPISPRDSDELPSDKEKSSVFKQNGYLRLCSHSDHAVNGINGTIVPQSTLLKISEYVGCTPEFLNSEDIITFTPSSSSSSVATSGSDILFDILNILDKNADTEHYRVIQIQLSRIVLYNLQKLGFDREAFRIVELMQSKLEYLYYGKKAKKKSYYFGFNFSELCILRERTGVSIEEMFTGKRS